MSGAELRGRAEVDHNRVVLDRMLQISLRHLIERREGFPSSPRLPFES